MSSSKTTEFQKLDTNTIREWLREYFNQSKKHRFSNSAEPDVDKISKSNILLITRGFMHLDTLDGFKPKTPESALLANIYNST